MALKWNLTSKGLVVVCVPILFQLGVLITLQSLQNEAELAVARGKTSTEVSTAVSLLLHDFLDVLVKVNHEDYVLTPAYRGTRDHAFASLSRLKRLLAERPKDLRAVQETEVLTKMVCGKLDQLARQLRTKTPSPQQDDSSWKIIDQYRDRLLEKMGLYTQMLGEEQNVSEQVNNELTSLAQWSQVVLRVGALVEVLLILASAFWIKQAITDRIYLMTDNVRRFARREPLNPIVSGRDEISELDSVFHSVAIDVGHAAQRERDIVDHARDVICSLDETLHFLQANAAAEEVFGYTSEKLVGMKLSDAMLNQDLQQAATNFENSKSGSQAPFELRIKREDGASIDTLWSVRWTKNAASYFCVALDDSERKKADRLRRELVELVTDDLRTPLFTCKDFFTQLKTDVYGELNARGQQLLSPALHSTVHMVSLIDDLLDIEKMEQGKLELNYTLASVSSIFDRCLDAVFGMAGSSKVNIKCVVGDEKINVDADRVAQIIINLLSNAIKFSPRESTITLAVSHKNDSMEFSITDQGRGIPAKMLPLIFDRFRQTQISDATEKGGSGLGLAICKALVELQGGDISVESEEDKGSRFSFRLPLEREKA